MQSRVLEWSRSAKRGVVLALDMGLSLLSTWLAFSLRLDVLHWPVENQWWVYALTTVLFVPIFIRFGLYRAIFRYTGQAALLATAKATILYACLLLVLLHWMQQWVWVPRSLGILQPLIFFSLVGASRTLARLWLSGLARRRDPSSGRFLIFGAGTAGVQTALAMAVSTQFELVGFVDDDPAKIGHSVNGVPVYAPSSVAGLVETRGVSDILLALPTASRARRKAIIESLREVSVHIRTLPDWADLASGRVTVQDFKELDIEDLLGRDPVPPNTDLLARNLAGKVVLVTGAGGSIGSELCRQIMAERPRQLLLLDHSEYNLYSIDQELRQLASAQGEGMVEVVPLLGTVADPRRLREVCDRYRPQTVYHAAAYKHVPLVESNPAQGIENNVVGTLNMARVAQDSGVESFVLVSTDKAVRPTNVMGASKRMAELVLQALADRSGATPTRFCMVRFGNVLGSSGSVVPLFRQQLMAGGPLTVTHAEVTRYFMTIPEAAQLVLQAGAMAMGGEVFVLDMGEPVKIIDLARRMVELSGLTVRDENQPDGDIAIAITGLRPGEKLYEELLIGDNPTPTDHARIMKAHEAFLPWPELEAQLEVLRQAAQANDTAAIKTVLHHCVHGYQG